MHNIIAGESFVNYRSDNKFVSQFRSNVKSDLIEITEDKLENILLKHLKASNIRLAWISPTSVLMTLILSLATATFTDKYGLKADYWLAVFSILTFAAAAWLLFTFIRMCCLWKTGSIPFLVKTIKNAKE